MRSPGFDPDRDLEEVGIANQTTMLNGDADAPEDGEGCAIVQRAGMTNNHVFDTICGATQDRQDALYELLNLLTSCLWWVATTVPSTHLVDIAREHVPTYFIESAECIKSIQDAFENRKRKR